MPADSRTMIEKPTVLENVLALYVRYIDERGDGRVHCSGRPTFRRMISFDQSYADTEGS